jgi:predicted glutamine amidotransferase
MCDLFALSASRHRLASASLPLFAMRGRDNVHGWGIGFFRQARPIVEKSGERVYAAGRLHDSFQRLARVVHSPVIVAHIRYKSSGLVDECHAHPFTLDFRGNSWLFAHNGKAPAREGYQSRHTPILAAQSDSARIFEYIRDFFLEASPRRADGGPAMEVLREGLGRLVAEYPGEYNFILTNGRIIWAFTNHRQFLLLKGSRKLEDALLLTTIAEGLSPENWEKVEAPPGSPGKILLIIGGDLILAEDLRGPEAG